MIYVESPHPPGAVAFIGQETARFHAFTACFTALNVPAGSTLVSGIGYQASYNRNAAIENGIYSCAACFHLHKDAACKECECKEWVDRGMQWINIWDDDHVFPPDTLIALLDKEVDVVVPFYSQRQPPFRPCIYKGYEEGSGWTIFDWTDLEGRDGLFPIMAAGAGGILIRRRVIDAIGSHWFTQINHIGEDMAFFKRVIEAGFIPFVALDVALGHVTPVEVWPLHDKVKGRWGTRVNLLGQPPRFVDMWSKKYEQEAK